MKTIIIEDYMTKFNEIKQFFKSKNIQVEGKHSYLSGLKEIIVNKYDLIILDMSLPNYDIKISERSGKERTYGGLDILHEIKRRKIESKVIIITQFDSFGEIGEKKSLEQLRLEIKSHNFENFKGLIHYDASSNDWEKELGKLLKECF